MAAYVALLRGINLGSHNKVAMPELRRLAEEIGLADLATYLQSGNLIFTAEKVGAAEMGERIESAIARSLGLSVPVVVRSHPELADLWEANPYPADDANVYVVFLKDDPSAERLESLAAHPLASPRPGGESFTVVGRHVYAHTPAGYARTKLSNASFERQLKVVGTARNMRTTRAMLEMTGALDANR